LTDAILKNQTWLDDVAFKNSIHSFDRRYTIELSHNA
jgi:hypothetical protein